jgi:hypothetical protein
MRPGFPSRRDGSNTLRAMRGLIVALLTAGSIVTLPASASALKWTPVTGPTDSINEVGTARSPDGTLHVVWTRRTPGSAANTDDLLALPISAGGIVGSPTIIASAYATIGNPAIVNTPGGGLEVLFGAIQCTSPTCPSGLFSSTSSDGGRTWSTPTALYDRNANYGSSFNAVTLTDGTPFETWYGTLGVFVHRGTDPGVPDYDYQGAMGAACCGYYSNLATDAVGNVELAWDSNATNFLGVWVRSVDPATGAPTGSPLRMPGSVTTFGGQPSSVQMLTRTPIIALPGKAGQFYAAYPGGYPSTNKVLLWRVGSPFSTTIVNEAGDHNEVSLAADGNDRIWVFWSHATSGGPHVYARRLGPAGLERAIDLGSPPHAESIFAVDGAVSPGGDPEALALAGFISNTNGTYYVRGPQVAPPANGASVDLVKVSGAISFKLPGRGSFAVLLDRQQLPVGATIDATHGKGELQAANARGRTETVTMSGGPFFVVQRRRRSLLSLKLASAACKHGRVRTLSVSGGELATDGRYETATATHNARWTMQNECAGTLVKVTHGTVSVRNLVRKVTVSVHAGHSYFARR